MKEATGTNGEKYHVGDPVLDLAQGRPMIILDIPDHDLQSWSEANGYQLQDNYGNSRFSVEPTQDVVTCAYVGGQIKNEPSRTYSFPVARIRLIESHRADHGRPVAERVVAEVLGDLFVEALRSDDTDPEALAELAANAGIGSLAEEVADERINGLGEPEPEGEEEEEESIEEAAD